MATEGSARTLGLERVGRLEPGWHADLQLVDVDGPRGLPTPVEAHNLLDQLVLWRNGSHVSRVMVGGDWIVDGGEVIGGRSGRAAGSHPRTGCETVVVTSAGSVWGWRG